MWQNLLAERFGLSLHHDPREFAVEELVIAKGGPKLKESADDPTPPLSGEPPRFKDGELTGPGLVVTIHPGAGVATVHAIARAQSLSKLTGMLGNQVNRPVLDKTGLTGYYDFTLDFTAPLPGQSATDTASEPGVDLVSAVQQQLGLRIVASRASLDVLVIDKANKAPTAN
jgi:uncharacterized protein (TIGR03435 family)